MTKEEYLILREQPVIPVEALHQCFMEASGTPVPIDDFEKILTQTASHNFMVKGKEGVMKKVNYKTVVDGFYRYYNEKFGL